MSTLKAKVKIDLERKLGKIDPNIYGQLMARRKWVVPEALYQPAHPDAGEDGLRKKVVEEIKRVKPSMIRWPGGCTGTSYQWKDGIGPKGKRQNTIDIHFGYDTDNGFGTAEFVDFCRQIGAEPHINLSTGYGTMQEAMEWIEYCNYSGNSKYANLRREHGYPEPFNIKYWQIGNENYGPWEINSASAHDYAIIAREWSKAIKKMDKNNKVLVVGGTAFKAGTNWDIEVLTEAWNNIDYITGHRYWSFNTASGMHNYDQLAAVGCFEDRTMKAMGGLIDLIARDKGSAIKPRLAFNLSNS